MEAALEQIITLLGEPSGPTRAVAVQAYSRVASSLCVAAVRKSGCWPRPCRRDLHDRRTPCGRKNRPIPASPDSRATGSD